MAYTYEELLKMGAKPVEKTALPTQQKLPAKSEQSFTYEELQKMGAQPVAEKATSLPPQKSTVRKIVEIPGNVVIGAVKGVADLPREAASLGSDLADKMHIPSVNFFSEKILRPVLQKILTPEQLASTHEALLQAQQGLKEGTEQTSFTKPVGTAQKVGYGAEKIAEFFVPGGAAVNAGKAVEGANFMSKAPAIVKKVLPYVTKVGTEAAIAGGQTALQEGKADEKALGAGVATAGLSAAAKGVSKALESVPASLWKGILDRLSTSVVKNPKLEQQASKLGMVGTRKQILSEAMKNIQAIELHLDDVLKSKTGTINGANIAPYLDDLKKSYSVIPGEGDAVALIENLQKDVAGKSSMTLEEANNVKRQIYEKINKSYGKGTLEIPAKTEAQKQIARGLKEEIEKIAPEVKDMNAKQAIYLQVKKSIERTLNQRQKGIAGTGVGLYDLALGGLGTATLGPQGLGLIAVKKGAESALIKSGAAKLINYFNQLSPTKRALFYNALKGSVSEIAKTITLSKDLQNK